MKHKINLVILTALLIIFISAAITISASSQTSFPSDPRENPLPAGVRATAPINSGSIPDGIPTNKPLFENLDNSSQNNLNKDNSSQKNSIAKLIIPLLLAFIAICFLAVIFFVARNIFFSR